MYDYLPFDLNGTLCDPLEGASRSMNYALTEYGLAPVTAWQVAVFIGPPLNTASSRSRARIPSA